MSAKLRWKQEPAETGLRHITAGPRGSYLHDGKTKYAAVSAHSRRGGQQGWYWVAGWASGVPHYNSACDSTVLTESDAKDAAMAYVKQYLQNKEHQ